MSNTNKTVIVALAAVLMALILIYASQVGKDGVHKTPRTSPDARQARGDVRASTLASLNEQSRSLSRRAVRLVVQVEAVRDRSHSSAEFQQFFGTGITKLESRGSGTCIDKGIILTNYHVVAHASQIMVKMDKREVPATLLGSDALTDLAVLKIEGDLCSPARWGDSGKLQIGDFVWAIGSPFGLQRSVTFGIVSCTNQDYTSDNVLREFLQTDAAVNPGGSGGPLLNAAGEVVGINTAILGESFRGISFAIPSNQAQIVAKQLIKEGKIQRGWLGVRLEDRPSSTGANRVTVAAFTCGPDDTCPAEQAGVEIGDVILSWKDQPIDNAVQLARLIAKTKPGAVAQITVLRGEGELSLQATMGKVGLQRGI